MAENVQRLKTKQAKNPIGTRKLTFHFSDRDL